LEEGGKEVRLKLAERGMEADTLLKPWDVVLYSGLVEKVRE